MEFDCKLAHRDEIKRLADFSSIKELYGKIGQVFKVETSDILYCTLNTHNFRNMGSILNNHLSYGDLIIVHLCGPTRDVTIKKSQEFLGLTITDNSIGRSFVKRVKSEDTHVEENIKPGDHIVAINSTSTIGMRHHEVAKAIRQVPQGVHFKMSLIEPEYNDCYLKSDMKICQERENIINGSTGAMINSTFTELKLGGKVKTSSLGDDISNSSLPIEKLLSKTTQANRNRLTPLHGEDAYRMTIEKINNSLESFLGISDNLLAIKIYRLARENKHSYTGFSGAIGESDLKEFDFNEEMKDYLWKCAID